ncbi:MAG: hypothetical protein LBH24_04475 [Clostridiales bacterium]|jgi:hypothetical protein|nr:hypothetical protein [Clostridiales bacterium]
MPTQNFEINLVMSEEGVPGGLSVGARPKSYNKFKDMFDAAKEVRKIDDLRELRIAHYDAFSPFNYQREAVLRMLGRFRGKGIFGDQVGLGKTVEVGMAVAEFAERGAIQSVLLLCPGRLVFQWEQEIQEKFAAHFSGKVVGSLSEIAQNERAGRGEGAVTVYIMSFQHVIQDVLGLKTRLKRDVDALNREIAAERFSLDKSDGFSAKLRRAERLSALHRRFGGEVDGTALEVLDMYAPEAAASMLIVDEADALLSPDPNKRLNIYSIAAHLSKAVPYKILLSATPIRRQLGDIYLLMNIVRPHQFRDKNDFIQNYCYGNAQLSDFTGEQLPKLKGIIDQLFTRNRLAGKNVQNSLLAMSIEEALKINFSNFSDGGIQEAARDAVFEGLSAGESGPIRAEMRTAFFKNQSLDPDAPNYWAAYVYGVFYASDDRNRPFSVTPDKDAAFCAALLSRLDGKTGAGIDALRFSLRSYVIPKKSGHLIKYRGDAETMDDVEMQRQSRRMMRELGRIREGYENFKRDDYLCKGKFTEFDLLTNGLLAGKKAVVFSETNAVRNLFIRIVGGRALNAKRDANNANYFKFKSDDPAYRDAVYFAVTGQEKGVNMQFCANLIIADLPHDPNLVEQIVGRVSRINQREEMNIYVFAEEHSLEHCLYNFYHDVLHLFTDWDGDNTFIIGGAVAAFLAEFPAVGAALEPRLARETTEDGERAEIGFPQLVRYLYDRYQTGYISGGFEQFPLWRSLVGHVNKSIRAFKDLVEGFGEQSGVEPGDWQDI